MKGRTNVTGVLILAHGSREKQTEATLDSVVDKVKEILGLKNIEKAFLQFSEKSLEKGLLKLINNGVKEVKIVPYFLFEGVHIKKDIPEKISEFLKDYPDVKITFGRTLEDDDRLAELLADRIKELI